MYTDFYLTNSVAGRPVSVAFYQQHTASTTPGSRVFKVILECPYKWSHRVRISWDLHFCLVGSSGSTTSARLLKTTYRTERDRFLIAKDGIVTVRQSYGNGQQLITIEQTKGHAWTAVRLYRGAFLIAEEPFRENEACFRIDTLISILEKQPRSETAIVAEQDYPPALHMDLTGLKTVHLSLSGTTGSGVRLLVDDTKTW